MENSEKSSEKKFDLEALKMMYSSRKQFAIHTDVAIMFETGTKKLEEGLGVKLTYSDYLYGLVKNAVKGSFYEVVADTLFHKSLRLNISKVSNSDEFFSLKDKLKKNRNFIIEIQNLADSVINVKTSDDLIHNSELILERIEENEHILMKDFRTATINLLKRAYSKHTDAFSTVRTLKELKRAIREFMKRAGDVEENKIDYKVLQLISDETLIELIKESENSELEDELKKRLIETFEGLLRMKHSKQTGGKSQQADDSQATASRD